MARQMVTIVSQGHFDKSIRFLYFLYNREFSEHLEHYAQQGVNALAAATPVNTGKTAASWYYDIKKTPNHIKIYWCNSNMAGNTQTPIAVLVQYGHATRNGAYVQGKDFINPAIQPIFDEIAASIWREVTNA